MAIFTLLYWSDQCVNEHSVKNSSLDSDKGEALPRRSMGNATKKRPLFPACKVWRAGSLLRLWLTTRKRGINDTWRPLRSFSCKFKHLIKSWRGNPAGLRPNEVRLQKWPKQARKADEGQDELSEISIRRPKTRFAKGCFDVVEDQLELGNPDDHGIAN